MITKNSIKRKLLRAFVSHSGGAIKAVWLKVSRVSRRVRLQESFAIGVMGQISALLGSSLSCTPQRSAQLIQSLLMTLEGDSLDKCNYTGNKGAAN